MAFGNWDSRKYIFEFLSIFIAVVLAFALNNWNENRKERITESKILEEILNGLDKDEADVDINVGGHKAGQRPCPSGNTGEI